MAVWIALCVHTLLSYWLNESAWSDGELYTLYFIKMTALTFPMGLLVVTIGEFAVTGLAKIGLDLAMYFSHQMTVAIIWLVMLVTGFLQWFVFTPIIYKRFRQKFSEK